MIDIEIVTRFMLENFQQVDIKDSGKHFLARCPLCGDSKKNQYKKRFNLNWNNGIPGWHCFNCDAHGNFYEIYGRLKGLSPEEVKKELYKWDDKKVKKYIKNKSKRPKSKEEEKSKEENFNWIKDKCYCSISKPTKGILERKYINILKDFYEERKISKKYKMYICFKGRYKNRIIIPIFDNKNIIYFQARRIPGSGITPKYDNPIAAKELCILNKNKFDRDKYIIVNEGPIDALMIGSQGTTCLGKDVSEKLLKELFKLTDKNIIIALDNDIEAYKSLFRFMKKNILSRKLKYFIYPQKFEKYKDINEIVVNTPEYIDVYSMIVDNSVNYSTAIVKLKLKGVY